MKKNVIRLLLCVVAFAASGAASALNCQSDDDGDWNDSDTWSCGRVPTASDTVVIRNGDTVSLNVNTAAIQSLTINSGGVLQNNGTRTLNLAGNLVVTGTGRINLPNSTLTLAANSRWSGTATGTAISLAAINMGGRDLTFSNTASYTIALSGATPLSNHGSFNNNGANRLVTIQLSGANQAWEVYSTIYPQLQISGSGTKTYGASSIAILGNLTIDAGTTFDTTAATGGNTIGGNLSRDGTFTTAPGSGTWTFNGSSPQTIGGGVSFYQMTVANGGSGVYLSNGDLAIGNGSSGALQLTGGNVITGSGNKVTVSTPCNNNLISGSGWINGNLQLTFPGFSATCTFRVGDNTTAAPVVLNIPFSGGIGGNAGLTLTASTTPGDHPNIGTSGLNAARSVNRYWTLGASGDTFGCVQEGSDVFNPGRYTATFQFAASDRDAGSTPANYKVGRYFGGWAAPDVSATSATSTSIEVLPSGGYAPFGTFAVGEQSGAPSGNGPSNICSNVLPIAEWRMDEAAWNGTANEVKDSTGNGYNGVAAYASGSGPTATTAAGSPAYTDGALSTCRYGQFDRTTAPVRSYTYVQLSSFPSLANQFTFAGWIRTTDRTASGQRIIVNDDAQNGWGFSLGDGTAGSIRLFNRNISNSGAVSGDGVNGNCGVFCVDTNAVVNNNTWYFVAATVNTASQQVNVYVFNTAGTRLAKVTGNYAGNWLNGSGAVAIGGETAASSEGRDINYHFRGNIDEVKVYSSALSENNLKDELKRARSCGSLDHVEFVHDGNALTCSPEPITVLGCTSSASCQGAPANQSGDSFTVTPTVIAGTQWCADAQCNTVLPASFSLSNGAVIYLRKPTTGTIRMAGTSSPAANATLQCRNTAAGLFGSTTACDIDYAASGLILNAVNHVSCAEQTITIRAVKANDAATACVPAFENVNRSLALYQSYLNPSTGTRQANFNYVTSSGGATSNVPALSTSSGAPTTLTNLYWNSSGTATLQNFRYDDVGQVQLNPSVSVPGVTPAGAVLTAISGHQFIAAPASFAFTTLPSGNIKAGENFSVDVTARNACATPTATPNFGKEVSAENVTLAFDSRVAPTGLNDCTNGPCDGSFSGTVASWTAGVGTSSNSSWSEVGRMRLRATLTSGNYLSSGVAAPAAVTAEVGNFVPAYFNTLVESACTRVSPATSFTYSGQPFTVTAIAKNVQGATTVNYSNLGACTVCSRLVTLSDASEPVTPPGTFSNNTIAASVFAKGEGKTSTVTYTLANKLAAPYPIPVAPPTPPSPPFKIRAKDSTTVIGSATPTEGNTVVRNGRLRLSNAFGSERQPLSMQVRAEYYSGNTWISNSDDSCTTLQSANFHKVSVPATLAPLVSLSNVALSNGVGVLTLGSPGVGNTGYVDIAANLGTSGNDQSCLSTHGGTPGNRIWLRSQYGNCAATYDRDPSARANFGIYSNGGRVVHVRELF